MAQRAKSKVMHPKVGDRVGIEMAGRLRGATVIEDRGKLGVGGARIVRLDVDTSSSAEPYRVEVPEDWLKPAPS